MIYISDYNNEFLFDFGFEFFRFSNYRVTSLVAYSIVNYIMKKTNEFYVEHTVD